jgi:hypothetical protein
MIQANFASSKRTVSILSHEVDFRWWWWRKQRTSTIRRSLCKYFTNACPSSSSIASRLRGVQGSCGEYTSGETKDTGSCGSYFVDAITPAVQTHRCCKTKSCNSRRIYPILYRINQKVERKRVYLTGSLVASESDSPFFIWAHSGVTFSRLVKSKIFNHPRTAALRFTCKILGPQVRLLFLPCANDINNVVDLRLKPMPLKSDITLGANQRHERNYSGTSPSEYEVGHKCHHLYHVIYC